ncbi:MAG: aminotransferase class I/II-fold pyridoxal phosphate-dependent enzyme [Thermoanaerobaculia bacterium]
MARIRRPRAFEEGIERRPNMDRRDFLRAGAAVGAVGLGRMVAFPDRSLSAPQVPGQQASSVSVIRLNSNENPLGLSPSARMAVEKGIAEANRYPDAAREELAEALAVKLGVKAENIVLGNGSTEILQIIVQASNAPQGTLVMADPTFEAISFYQRTLTYATEKVPLTPGFAHDIQQMKDRVAASKGPAVVYLCNPNNPTGTLTSSAEIDAWIGEAPETVQFAVDEAYLEYVKAPGYWSAIPWIQDRPNVIVARTFSKIYGMAGMRLGYAVAHPETARRLREFLTWDNANSLALAAGLASLADEGLQARGRAVNEVALTMTRNCLDELGLGYLPSHTNFLMHRIQGDVKEYIGRMRQRGLHVGRPFPALPSYNRLSMGLPEEMEIWAETLKDFRRLGWV